VKPWKSELVFHAAGFFYLFPTALLPPFRGHEIIIIYQRKANSLLLARGAVEGQQQQQ
jgi:hypothetical protein